MTIRNVVPRFFFVWLIACLTCVPVVSQASAPKAPKADETASGYNQPPKNILDVMRDTGFIGARLTQFPQILQTYNITATQMQAECSKRGVQVITISFNGPAHIQERRAEMLDNAKKAMTLR